MQQFKVESIRKHFPIFDKMMPNGKPLVYLDNAASTQKPQVVLDSMEEFYTSYYSNIGRGIYWPASASTQAFEDARKGISEFIKAASASCIIFTSGATDSINKVTNSFLRPKLKPGDEVVISEMEHHSNLIPWQQVCNNSGASLRVIPLIDTGDLDYRAYTQMLSPKTKFVAVTALSNTLGVINDLELIVSDAHRFNIPVLVDAAQSIAHGYTDLSNLDCDFLAFSGHKIFGPTGIGVLYGKQELLEEMDPAQFGGGTVKEVKFEKTIFREAPAKHEAGTPNIAGAIGLASALRFVKEIGRERIQLHTQSMLNYAIDKLGLIEGLQILANPEKRGPIISFTMEDIHPHDISGFLAEEGIAIRAGHHCTQPLIDLYGLPGTSRISFAMYNTTEEIDFLADTLTKTRQFFQ